MNDGRFLLNSFQSKKSWGKIEESIMNEGEISNGYALRAEHNDRDKGKGKKT